MLGWMSQGGGTDFAKLSSRVRIMTGAQHDSAEAGANVLASLA